MQRVRAGNVVLPDVDKDIIRKTKRVRIRVDFRLFREVGGNGTVLGGKIVKVYGTVRVERTGNGVLGFRLKIGGGRRSNRVDSRPVVRRIHREMVSNLLRHEAENVFLRNSLVFKGIGMDDTLPLRINI